MREIDLASWERAAHYQAFRNSVQPQYCLTFPLDVTEFLQGVRARGLSFTFSFIFAVTKCANEIEAFRCRFLDGKPVVYDTIHTAFTYLDPGGELFKVVNVRMQDTVEAYAALAAETARAQTAYFTGPMPNDVYQFSPVPWLSFTSVSHTASGDRDDAVPRMDFGKYFARDGRTLLPFSVQVHHSFVDGVHIGRLAERLQAYLHRFARA